MIVYLRKMPFCRTRFVSLLSLSAFAVFILAGWIQTSSSGDSSTPEKSSQVRPQSLASGDRVIDAHERRSEQLRKDCEAATKELDEEVARRKGFQEELASLRAKRQELEEKQRLILEWKDATFVVASDRTAFAVQANSADRFRLLAKEDLKRGEFVQKIARRFSIPIVHRNDSAFEADCVNLTKGSIFPQDATKILKEHWKIRRYLPIEPSEEKRMVVFRDLETTQHRVGYFLGTQRDRFEFVSLTGKSELIARDRIESGSSRIGTYQELLVEPEVNMVDVAALEIARNLSSSREVPTYHLVTISVDADELKEALLLSKQIDETANDHLLDLLSRLSGEPYVPDQRKEGPRILRRYADVLHDQLSHRLVEIGVPVGNREDLEVLRAERNRAQDSDFDQRRYSLMTSASHMVTAKVGKAIEGGKFRISIRLNEVNSGKTLLELHSETGRIPQQYPKEYVVDSGSLVILNDPNAGGKPSREQQGLKLPDLDKKSIASRLGVFSKVNGKTQFYDLFSSKGYTIESNTYRGKPISDTELPPNNQKFRWLTWKLANAALPAAGRVRSIDGDRIEINLGSNHGLQSGSVLRVMRRSELDYRGSTRILPFEIKADTVLPKSTTAVVQQDGLTQLWPDISIELDDLVLPRGVRNPTIGFDTPKFSPTLAPDKVSREFNSIFKNATQIGRLNRSMDSCSEQLLTKMLQGLHSQGYESFSVNPANPTHIVSTEIAPLEANPDCNRFAIQLTVRSLEDRDSSVFPVVEITSKEVAQWQP